MPATTQTQKTPQEIIAEDIAEASKKLAAEKKPEGTLSDFAKRFQGKSNPDGTIVQGESDPPDPNSQQSPQKPRSDLGKKPSYVKTIEAEKAALEEEKTALSAEKESLSAKITELTSQLSTAKSPKDIEAILAERDAAIKDRDENLSRLSKENESLKSKVTLYDLTEDPEFVSQFVEPINRASEHVMELISGDDTATDKISQVAALNNGILSTSDVEKRRRLQDQRDMIIGEIADGLVSFRRDDFLTNMRDLITLSKKRSDALANHSQTFEKIQSARKDAAAEASRKVSEQWGGAFNEVSKEIDALVVIPDEISTFITTNSIPLDTARDEDIAISSIKDGAKNYSPRDVARILKQGAVFGKLKAKSDAQEKIIAQLNETISDLKGAGTRGNGSGSTSGKKEETEGKSAAFFGKFQPPR